MTNKKSGKPASETRKQTRLREREQQQQRIIFISLGIVAALIVAILAIGFWRYSVAILDDTIATVNGIPIKVHTYQARARAQAQQITARIAQLQQTAAQFDFKDPSMQSLAEYYQKQLAADESQLIQVSANSLETVIDDELVRQEALKRGITIPPSEV